MEGWVFLKKVGKSERNKLVGGGDLGGKRI